MLWSARCGADCTESESRDAGSRFHVVKRKYSPIRENVNNEIPLHIMCDRAASTCNVLSTLIVPSPLLT